MLFLYISTFNRLCQFFKMSLFFLLFVILFFPLEGFIISCLIYVNTSLTFTTNLSISFQFYHSLKVKASSQTINFNSLLCRNHRWLLFAYINILSSSAIHSEASIIQLWHKFPIIAVILFPRNIAMDNLVYPTWALLFLHLCSLISNPSTTVSSQTIE